MPSDCDLAITFDGVRYLLRIAPQSYRVSRANDFVPRISTGKLTNSDFDTWFAYDQDSLGGGLGVDTAEDDRSVFYDSDHELNTVGDVLTLAAMWRESDPSFIAYQFIDFCNYTFAGGNNKVRKYNPATNTWTDSKTGLAAPVTAMERAFGKLFVALGNSTDMVSCSNADTDTWATETGRKGNCLRFWKGKLWRGNGGNLIAFDGTNDMTVPVGDPQSTIVGIGAFENYLVIGKDDGKIYYYDGATVYDLVSDLPPYSENFKNAKQHLGWVYYPIQGSVLRMAGISAGFTIQNITPKNPRDRIWGWGLPKDIATSQRYVYVLFNLAENSYPALLRFNEKGWHVVWKGVAGRTAYGCYHSRVSGCIFVNDGTTWAQKITTYDDTPYNYDYPTSQRRWVYLPHLTAGLHNIRKIWRDVELKIEDVGVGLSDVVVQYMTDRDGVWRMAGTVVEGTNVSVSFSQDAPVVATDLWIRIGLLTYNSSVTPKVYFPITVRFLPRPETVYAISATILCENQIYRNDGLGKIPLTATQILDLIRRISNSPKPVTLETPDGLRWTVVMTNIGWLEGQGYARPDA